MYSSDGHSHRPSSDSLDDNLEQDSRDNDIGGFNRAVGPHLEFVDGWNVFRIVSVFLLLLVFTVAALMLWTFLGVPRMDTALEGAGERLETAVLLGTFLFMVGLTSIVGWLGISWLVM
jgi:hypothetical protein